MKTRVQTRCRRRSGFTLLEVMIAMVCSFIMVGGTIMSVQTARRWSRNLSLEYMGENMAVSLMEMIKRSGYNEIQYGADLPSLLSTSLSPLLNFPAGEETQHGDADVMPADVGSIKVGEPSTDDPPAWPGGDDAVTPKLPDGAPGNATGPEAFSYHTNGAVPSAIASDVNYLEFSEEQLIALNGYQSAKDAEGKRLLDPDLRWGVYIEEFNPADMTYPVKLVVVVVKWNSKDGRWADKPRFVALRTLVSNRTPRI